MLGFGKKPLISPELSYLHVFYHEDFSHKDLNELKVGRKGLSLFEIQDMDVPVPAFFVVSPVVYKEHLYKAFDKKIIELLETGQMPEPRDIAQLIEKTNFEATIQESLIRAYSRLSGFSDAWVSVRSSVVFPNRSDVSFSGLFSTELNVRGFDDLLEAIKLVYSSIFTDKVALYAKANSVKLSELQMSVVVQKMVQAEVSGTAYTIDPITQDNTKMSVEAVFGLGDVIANGEITPDQYVLNKKDLAILEKQISPQEWMRVRKISSKREGRHFGSVEKIQISPSWSHQQKIEDRFLKDIAKVALIIEDKSNTPQDVEWVWESGNVWVLQSKPIIPLNLESAQLENNIVKQSESGDKAEDLVDLAVGIVKSGLVEEKALEEAIKYVQKEGLDSEVAENTDVIKKLSLDESVGFAGRPRDAENGVSSNQESFVNRDMLEKNQKVNDVFDNTDGVDFTEAIKGGEILPEYLSASKVERIVQNTTSTPGKAIKEEERILDQFDKLKTALKQVKLDQKRDDTADDKLRAKTEQKQVLRQEHVGIKSLPYSLSYLMSGIGASFGVATGEVSVIDRSNYRFKYVTSQNILLLKEYLPEMNSLLFNSGGVIMTVGGLTSDVAILCRELGIPAVMNAIGIDQLLSDNEMVQVDGSFGAIYKIIPNTQIEYETVSGVSQVSAAGGVSQKDGFTGEKTVSDLKAENYSVAMSDTVNLMKKSEKLVDDLGKVRNDGTTDEKVNAIDTERETHAEIPENVIVDKRLCATKVMLDLSDSKYSEIVVDVDYHRHIKLSDGVAVIDLDQMILDEKKHPMDAVAEGKFADYANWFAGKLDKIADALEGNELIVAIGSASVAQLKKILKKKSDEESTLTGSTIGALRLVKQSELLKRELIIVKRLRNVFRNRNVSLAIHSPGNADLMGDIKKEISALGLRRTSTFNIYAILNSPAEIIMAGEIMNVEIDGLIVNAPQIARDMQGISKKDQAAIYDLSAGSVLKVIDVAVDSARANRKRVIVNCGDSKTLTEHCVREGVYGVAVDYRMVMPMRSLVADTETSIVLGIKRK